MAVTLEQFANNLVKSGLVSASELAELLDKFSATGHPPTLENFARELYRAGKVTKYQVGRVFKGQIRGLILGEYEVFDQIGSGGMGEVFKARHRRMDRVVALKVLSREAMKSDDSLSRFQREVRAAARLDHPNIVTAFDASEHRGIHYLVMEFVDGPNLAALVKEHGPLPVEEAIDYILQAARGLEYAHSRGVLHRDIKPGNLLADKQGKIKVLDMGLARIQQGDSSSDVTATEQLTGSDRVLGTCDYMAPEQAEDPHAADHRADIYSLGCTFFRLLTGKVPYEASTVVKTLLMHREEPVPSLCKARPDVPSSVEAVFRKMVAKDREDRHQSMAELIADLESEVAARESPSGSLASAADRPTDTALRSFLDEVPQPSVTTKQRTKPVHRETVDSEAERETDPDAAEKATAPSMLKRPLFLGIALGGATLLSLLLFFLVRGGDQPEETPGATAATQPEAEEEREPESDAKVGTKQAEPKQGYLILDWPRRDRAGAVLEIDGKPRDITGLVDPADSDRLRLQMAEGEHRVWIARKGYQHFVEEVNIVGGEGLRLVPEWKSLAVLPMVEDEVAVTPPAEAQPVATAPDTASQPGSPDTGSQPESPDKAAEPSAAEQMVEAIPVEPSPPIAGQVEGDLERRQALEAQYAAATASAVALVAAWNYQKASETFKQIRFEEEELATRLSVWLDELKRMAELKAKIIARVNEADPPLKKSDLLLRGQNGQVTGANEKGIEAKLALDRVEHHAWADLKAKATTKLLRTTVEQENADELLAAALIAFAVGGYPLAEEFTVDARALGINVDPYVGQWADAEFAAGLGHLNQEQYNEAAAALKDLEARYGNTPWFADNKTVWEAAVKQTELAMDDGETQGTEPHETVGTSGITGLKYRTTFTGHPTTVEYVGFTPDGRFLVSLCQRTLYVWNTAGVPIRLKCDVQGRVSFSPDATRFAGIHTKDLKNVAIVDSPTGSVLNVVKGHGQDVTSVVFSPDGMSLASGSVDMTVRLWHSTGAGRVLFGHTGAVITLAFSRDGRMLASGSDDQSIRLWATGTSEEIGVLRGHTRPVSFVAFSPEADRLASASVDQTARIWDVKTFEELQQFPCKGSAALSPDGTTFACADAKFITLWNTETGKESLKIPKHNQGSGALAFSPDGKTLVSLCDLSIDLWDVETDTKATKELPEQSTDSE